MMQVINKFANNTLFRYYIELHPYQGRTKYKSKGWDQMRTYSTFPQQNLEQCKKNIYMNNSEVLADNYFFHHLSMSSFIRSIKNYAPVNWIRLNKIYLIDILHNHVIQYPTPISLTYA
jgi:hypothetical protein